MRHIATVVHSVSFCLRVYVAACLPVCLSVCLSVADECKLCGSGLTDRNAFEMYTREAQETMYYVGVRISPTVTRTFGGYAGPCLDLPAVDIINLIRKGAAAMRPLATCLL